MVVLGLLTPQSTTAKIEYQKIEYPYVVAITPAYIEPKIEYKSNGAVLKHYPSPLGFNCVEYAKSRKAIGTGYGTLQQKIAKIKTKTPTIGAVGVTPEGGYAGHLVVVEEIKTNTVIVSDGNFHRGFITLREIPKAQILGYL